MGTIGEILVKRNYLLQIWCRGAPTCIGVNYRRENQCWQGFKPCLFTPRHFPPHPL